MHLMKHHFNSSMGIFIMSLLCILNSCSSHPTLYHTCTFSDVPIDLGNEGNSTSLLQMIIDKDYLKAYQITLAMEGWKSFSEEFHKRGTKVFDLRKYYSENNAWLHPRAPFFSFIDNLHLYNNSWYRGWKLEQHAIANNTVNHPLLQYHSEFVETYSTTINGK